MRTVNSVTLLGNIARLPERRITAGGKSFATFVIATHKDSLRDGDKMSVPEFHNVVAWGSLAAIAENFCKKGRLVYVEGYLKTRSWNHENGAKIFRTEIVASNIIAVSGSDEEEDSFQSESRGERGGQQKNDDTVIENASDDDFFNISRESFFEE